MGAQVRTLPMATRIRHFICLLTLCASAACSDGVEPTPTVPCDENQDVTLSVSSGASPVFTWAPACGMAALEVMAEADATFTWALSTGPQAPQNPLRSGVRYGDVPSEATQLGPALSLSPGMYRVTVSRWAGDPAGTGSPMPAGEVLFKR
jgi:hypothetical protein